MIASQHQFVGFELADIRQHCEELAHQLSAQNLGEQMSTGSDVSTQLRERVMELTLQLEHTVHSLDALRAKVWILEAEAQ